MNNDNKILAVLTNGIPDFCPNCGGNKENRNIDPVGRFADHTVIRVKYHRNEKKPQNDPFHFYAPTIITIAEMIRPMVINLRASERSERPPIKNLLTA